MIITAPSSASKEMEINLGSGGVKCIEKGNLQHRKSETEEK